MTGSNSSAWPVSTIEPASAAAGLCITSAVALAVFDHAGRVLQANAALQRLLQREATDLVGQRLSRHLSPAGRVVFENHLLPLLHLNGQVQELALQLRPAQGADVVVLCSAARVDTPDGPRHECAFMPMSERKRTEDELLRLKRTAERLPGTVFQLLRQRDGRLQLPVAAQALRALLGLSTPDEDLFASVVDEDRAALLAGLQASAQAMAPWEAEFRVRLHDQVAWRAVEARPQSLSDGAVLWHGYASDVTARKQAEAALAEALKIKELLLYELNHRVKNNLQVISSLLSLQLRELQDADARQALSDAKTRVAVVAQLHQRLYQGDAHALVDYGAYARQLALDTLASLGAGQRIRLDYDAPASLTLDMDQAVPLSLALSELLTNAVKYAFTPGRHGVLRLHLRREAGQTSLLVADDGVGVPPDFDPAVDAGLGLRIVQALLHQVDARLEVLRPERGAAFRIVVQEH